MVIIGLVLFLAAGIFGVDFAVKNRFKTVDLRAFGESLGFNGSAHIYVLGAITGAALIIGLALLMAGLRHKGSKAVERRQDRKIARKRSGELEERTGELEQLRVENSDLRGRLDVLEQRSAAEPVATRVPVDTREPVATREPVTTQEPVITQERVIGSENNSAGAHSANAENDV